MMGPAQLKSRRQLGIVLAAPALLLGLFAFFKMQNFSQSSAMGSLGQPASLGLRMLPSVLSRPDVAKHLTQFNCSTLFPDNSLISGAMVFSEENDIQLTLTPDSDSIMSWIVRAEQHVHATFRALFREICPKRGLFVDGGANAGFYGVVAAAYGCQVVFFDPQPLCVNMIQRNLCLNRRFPSVAQGHVGIIAAPISADPSPLEMDLPPRCHGSFSVKTGLPQSDVPGQRMKYTINPVSMDDIFLGTGTRIDIMKIDTEGFEFNVLRSMRQLLMQKRVHYIIVEVAPERWLGEKIISREEATEEMLKIYDMQCSFKRVKLVNGDVHGSLEMSRDELKELLLHKMATMEDLLIQC